MNSTYKRHILKFHFTFFIRYGMRYVDFKDFFTSTLLTALYISVISKKKLYLLIVILLCISFLPSALIQIEPLTELILSTCDVIKFLW